MVQGKGFAVGMTLASITLVFLLILGAIFILRKIRDGHETLEDWEIEYGARRFRYSELFTASRGFGERNLVGAGGFGRVYRGVIPSTGLEVAIKRVSNGSRQGMKEFVAEITSMGRLRHRNLVQLHGWELHSRGEITRAIDPTLDTYHAGEAELVLTLGLLCCHPHPDYRPTMRRVVQFLLGDAILPPLPRDIHLEIPMTIPEYTDSFADDSDPSCPKMTSSESCSSTSYDKSLSIGRIVFKGLEKWKMIKMIQFHRLPNL
ncbi:hypothetical protein COLO4_20872 [Corchorus olitorius]|uniref:Protein kinase domain-containing protein n=1 Tax=Corchorus olitorius TaxID=93759 RepID=A0A1R3IWB6_9ROSI|nr:hypothetical protein COLO4_20872 [Corchorus olitorius]